MKPKEPEVVDAEFVEDGPAESEEVELFDEVTGKARRIVRSGGRAIRSTRGFLAELGALFGDDKRGPPRPR
jgi:hypothetical protein